MVLYKPLRRPYFWGGMSRGVRLTSRDGGVKGVLNGGRLDFLQKHGTLHVYTVYIYIIIYINNYIYMYISQRITWDDFYIYLHEWLIFDNQCRENYILIIPVPWIRNG